MAAGQNVDVSKKLKAAIKAKLEELGVYVDDELPEYIMVMIANKKEKNQMKDDLNLFLGKCTNKFVDWLFDLFERLQTAGTKSDSHSGVDKASKEICKEQSKSKERKKEEVVSHASTSRKEERKESRTHEQSHRQAESESKRRETEKEKEREKEREREKEKEREKIRQAEKLREKEREERSKELEREEKLREQEKSKLSVARDTTRPTRRQKERRSRSRSKTWSDDEFEQHVEERAKKVASSVIAQRPLAASPEPVKVSSQVHVMRKVKPATSEIEMKTMKAGSSMFLKAMNQASVSAGYGASLIDKKKSSVHGSICRSPLKNRLSRPDVIELDSDGENAYKAEVIMGEKTRARPISPQITVTLKGAREHIGVKKAGLKRRKEKGDGDARNGSVIVVPEKRGRTVEIDEEIVDGYESPSIRKWDGQIQLDEEDSTDDDEAKIDAVLADARGVTSTMDEDDEVPPTHQLSRGNSWSGYAGSPSQQPPGGAPNYVPTPLTKDEVNYTAVAKIPERCRFWPACRQGENCPYTHPSKQCINFPHCSFGARCLYIHPPCRFDRKCANPNCPYTHGRIAAAAVPVPVTTSATVTPQISQPIATSSPTSTAVESTKISPDVALSAEKVSPILTPCLFGSKCKKLNCAFKHPKACHYGILCMNASCYFYHPPQPKSTPGAGPVATKYKWKASSASA